MSATGDAPAVTRDDGADSDRTPGASGWRRTARRLAGQPLAMAALAWLVLLVLLAVFSPVIVPYDPREIQVEHRLEGPSAEHWLGTDDLGRDVLSRVVAATQVALWASFQSVSLGLVVGVSLGLLIGYRGGWWDRGLMRVVDTMASIPALLLALALIAVLGRGLTNAMYAVAIIFAGNYIRITRAVVLAEREQPYVAAARVLGMPDRHIMFRQILPNVAAPIIVQTSILLGTALLIEAMLSFLGLTSEPSEPSWGTMLDLARLYQADQPFLPFPPGLALTLCVLAFNLLGDGFRDALGRQQVRRARPVTTAVALDRDQPGAGDDADGDGTAQPALLRVRGLQVRFALPDGGAVTVVDDVSLDIRGGETFGLVGESGSGKSMTALALLGLVPPPGQVTAGSVRFAGEELLGLGETELGRVRGRAIGMVFQDPLASLSPVHTVGRQMAEPLRVHQGLGRRAAEDRAAELLALVGVPDARRRLRDYPHQFSGGMAQRVLIATALACDPKLLIADEPTTALDVTVQAQVLDLLQDLKEQLDMSVLLITHDLGVIADACDRVAVMYAGQIVETGEAGAVFAHPRHPYTAALLEATPHGDVAAGTPATTLPTIPGRVPPPWAWPDGCRFHPRCGFAVDACRRGPVALEGGSRCLRRAELTLGRAAGGAR